MEGLSNKGCSLYVLACVLAGAAVLSTYYGVLLMCTGALWTVNTKYYLEFYKETVFGIMLQGAMLGCIFASISLMWPKVKEFSKG
jgi:hypothetical protein